MSYFKMKKMHIISESDICQWSGEPSGQNFINKEKKIPT